MTETMVEGPEEDYKPGALFEHCRTVYLEMLGQAREEMFDSGEGAHARPVYEGHLTKLFAGLSLSTPYYTAVMKKLREMQCVEQIRRGGGNASSRWALNYEPTEEAFKNVESRRKVPNGRTAAIEQQVRSLTQRTNTLDDQVAALLTAFQELSTELRKLGESYTETRHAVNRVAVEVERINAEEMRRAS